MFEFDEPSAKAEEFDRLFDNGENITEMLDLSSARRAEYEPRAVEVAFPAWLLDRVDSEAGRLGISRQAMIVRWLSERLEQRDAERACAQG